MGGLGLLFTSVGSIIGSGWLFGALYAAQIAGPAAIFSWLIGGVMILIIALVYAELATMFPVSGGVVRFPHYAYGSLTSFAVGWFSWLHVVASPAIEVIATLQYATNYIPWLSRTGPGDTVVLTTAGYGVAAGLLLLFSVINLLGVRMFARANNALVWWKLAIIAIVVIGFFIAAFHGGNFTEFGGFAPYGAHGMFSAIASAGIVFSFLGFRQAIELAGESTNPQRAVPFAVVGSVLITAVIYVALQIAFLGAVPTGLVSDGGWAGLSFANVFGPLAGVAGLLGLSWLAILLYIDAMVSPLDTGFIYSAVTPRITYAMGRNRNAPRAFTLLNDRGVPWVGVVVAFVVGLLLMVPFGGWQQLVGFITSAATLSFATGPPVLAALRRQLPEQSRPFKLPTPDVFAFLAFYAANLIVFWTGWHTNWRLLVAVGLGFVLFALQYRLRQPGDRPSLEWKPFSWVPGWLAGLAVISGLGSFGNGAGIIGFTLAFPVIAVFSALILWWAVAARPSPEQVRINIAHTAAAGESEAEREAIERTTGPT